MIQLTPNECRVLGVLVEKAQTTPQQYPLTLNALTSGCNQKNNREPVTDLSEEKTLEALDGLRSKGLAREVMLSGSRVEKFRHVAREALELTTPELVVLAELLLRGPQTVGELRNRALRMHPLESTEIVKNVLDSLMGVGGTRPEPMVRELPPAPGDRAPRYAQLLCPKLHPLDAPPASPRVSDLGGGGGAASNAASGGGGGGSDLARRVASLEQEVASLRATVEKLAAALGEPA